MILSPLSDNHSLELFYKGQMVFSSKGHWLHPLFELENFLNMNWYNREELYLHDSVSGRAAAILTCRLGIKHVTSDLGSALARTVFEKNNVQWQCLKEVPKILCKTETLIEDSMTVEEVYSMLLERATASKTIS
ncbi:MAG: DUF1893 domain-containing protein [Sphaerochaetaceae bacterium]|nr:DUF1893 domain-containing protein [Sphaerochaetaceae bacterium]